MEDSLTVPQKVRELSIKYDLVVSYPRELKPCSHKNLHINVHSSIVVNSPNNGKPKWPSFDE